MGRSGSAIRGSGGNLGISDRYCILGKTDLAGNVDVDSHQNFLLDLFFILEIFGIPNGTVWW